MHCTQCGVKNQDTARFCQSCGAALQAAVSAAPPPPPARTSPALVGAFVALLLLFLALSVVVTVMLLKRAEIARVEATLAARELAAKQVPVQPTLAEPQPSSKPVPAEDPVAEAQVVLENYLAADLGHDGNEMKKYLGGQAAARFVAEVQGQEDVTTHSEEVSGHTIKDDNTIVFSVAVGWSPAGSSEVKTQTDRYVVKRTDEGWKITSTPAYPG